ncbi:MAG TPA: hypothetical protein VGS07_24845 [Thermoanaerobaculia bacterium]|jgi:hypothetical protein|nr:hypothetical protein [Thermoanaerobaculia bacterium]
MTGLVPSALPDLLRALTVLRPADDAGKAAVARFCGIEVALPAPSEPVKPPPPPPIQIDPPKPPIVPPAGDIRPPVPALPEGGLSDQVEEVPSVLVPDYTESRQAPDWLETVEPFPEADGSIAAPVLEPLLVPQWARGILAASMATLSEAGTLDVERLVRGIARGIPWRRIPRRPWPTLARGVLVLVDRSDALLPFAVDQEQIVEQIRAVVGRDSAQVLDFEGNPSWGVGTGSQEEWEEDFERWRPPAGTPVLALTDLGIGTGYGVRPVHPAAWRAFADRLRRAGCPLVAFIPYAPERWPADLGRALHILPWDRGTSARTVRRALGKALRLPGGGDRP